MTLICITGDKMKRRKQKLRWRTLHGEDHKLELLMLHGNDEDFVDNLNDCLEAFHANIHPVLIPSGSSGI